MSDRGRSNGDGPGRQEAVTPKGQPLASGSGLHQADGSEEHQAGAQGRTLSARPGAALSTAAKPVQHPSSFQRTVGAVKTMLPLMQKLLPLLDGNVASVVANVLLNRPMGPAVDLEPLEIAIDRLRAENRELRDKNFAQNAALQRIGDELELVKEAAERQALAQTEMVEDLRRLRTKVAVMGWLGLGLMVVSFAGSVFILLRVEQILH